MKCKQAEALIDEYNRNELSPEKKQAFEDHIQSCASCKKLLETYRLLLSDTKIEDDFPMPPQLNAKILYALQQVREEKKVPFYRNKRVISFATACCFLLAAGIFGANNYEQFKALFRPSMLTSEIQTVTTQKTPTKTNSPSETETKNAQVTPQTEPITEQTPAPKIRAQSASTLSEPDDATAPVSDSSYTTQPSEMSEPIVAVQRNQEQLPISEHPADFTVSGELKDEILENYPHTELAENIFSVQIPEEKLEEILNIMLDFEEPKSEFVLEFLAE